MCGINNASPEGIKGKLTEKEDKRKEDKRRRKRRHEKRREHNRGG